MAKWQKVGQGSYGVYRKKKTDWGGIAAGIVILLIIVAAIANG